MNLEGELAEGISSQSCPNLVRLQLNMGRQVMLCHSDSMYMRATIKGEKAWKMRGEPRNLCLSQLAQSTNGTVTQSIMGDSCED